MRSLRDPGAGAHPRLRRSVVVPAVRHLGDRLVGYCSSCRFFRFHDEEADTLHPQLRFGRCRLRVKAVPASCERYEPARPPGGR